MKMKEKLHVSSLGFMCKLWQVDKGIQTWGIEAYRQMKKKTFVS
jgi:hypothetical protein